MDSILNMLLSGWCADAMGARLEFLKERFNEERVQNAMNFRGYSTTCVGTGQITDDSELEIALLYGLVDGILENSHELYPTELVAKRYLDWFHSDPFDVGNTTTMAFHDAHDANSMKENTSRYNQTSESNGALMRSAALAAMFWHLSPDELMKIAKQDAQLTHVSPVIHEINGLYVAALGALLQCAIHNERADGFEIIKWMCETAREPTVKRWIEEGLALASLDDYNALCMVGHAKHAFVMVVYFLNNMETYSYETAIAKTLQCGGDTDTNAKIVGSLVGAYYSNCIPGYIMNTVLEFDCTQYSNTHPRPACYSVLHVVRYLHIHKDKFTPASTMPEN